MNLITVKKLFALLLILTTLTQCSVVSTLEPLPKGDQNIIRYLPEFFKGEFVVKESDGTWSDSYVLINWQNNQYCFIEAFSLLEEDELRNLGYSIKGNFIHYRNDSLIERLNYLENNDSQLSYSEKSELDILKKKKLSWSKSYELVNDAYLFDKKLIYELNLKDGRLVKYKESEFFTYKVIMKKIENFYILNVLSEDEEYWTSILISDNENIVSVGCIDYYNLKNNQDYYDALMKITRVEDDNIQIELSDYTLKELLINDSLFNENVFLLKPVNKNNYTLLLSILGSLAILGTIIFISFKIKKSKIKLPKMIIWVPKWYWTVIVVICVYGFFFLAGSSGLNPYRMLASAFWGGLGGLLGKLIEEVLNRKSRSGILNYSLPIIGFIVGTLISKGIGNTPNTLNIEESTGNLLLGAAAGAICALLPYEKIKLINETYAGISFWFTIISGGLGGLLLSVPISILLTIIGLSKHKNKVVENGEKYIG